MRCEGGCGERHFEVAAAETLQKRGGEDGLVAWDVHAAVTSIARGVETSRDGTIYTGYGGIGLAMQRVSECSRFSQETRETARRCADDVLARLLRLPQQRSRQSSFLDGYAGMLLVIARLSHARHDIPTLRSAASAYVNLVSIATDPSTPDEFLYGRAGYLHGLRMLRTFESSLVATDVTAAVIGAIMESGRKGVKEVHNRHPAPLRYTWHGKEYVGGAHGYCGIMHSLLLSWEEISDVTSRRQIRSTIDFMLEVEGGEGTLPSSLPDGKRGLVHFCHGAPGGVLLFTLAHRIFRDDKYLQAAIRLGEVVYTHGLLRKGPGLCHGVSGNGYILVNLHRATHNPKWLQRARVYADFALSDVARQGSHVPDNPSSLFEGSAGAVWLAADLAEGGEGVVFPVFEM